MTKLRFTEQCRGLVGTAKVRTAIPEGRTRARDWYAGESGFGADKEVVELTCFECGAVYIAASEDKLSVVRKLSAREANYIRLGGVLCKTKARPR
jgi:hypothetical protein